MKIALQSSAYNNLSLKEELLFTQSHNIRFFDVFFDKYLPIDLSKSDLEALIGYLNSGNNISVHLPISDYKIIPEFYEGIKDFILKYKPYSTTIHFDKLSYDVLDVLCKDLTGVTKISIENTVQDLNSLYDLNYVDFMKKVNKNYPIFATLDTGHCFINKRKPKDLALILNKNLIKISTIHIHDNSGQADDHNALGKGKIPLKQFINYIIKNCDKPLFIIEHWNDNLISLKYLNDFNQKI